MKPDLTILIDLDVESSLARAHARNLAAPHCETRMDDQSIDFHRKVYEAYQALVLREPDRVKRVDGRQETGAIERDVWNIVSCMLETHV